MQMTWWKASILVLKHINIRFAEYMMDTIFWPLTPLKSVNLFGGLYKDRRYIKGHITFVSICKKNASQNKFLEIMAESIIFTVV